MTATDAQLLADFATRRDEAAFRELARRHLGLVFHTALRCTGNRTLSEEIAQNVLCAVAGKAGSLSRHPERFAPWLHRVAVYESSKAMRKEASHQRRSRLEHPDAVSATVNEEDGRWQAVLPLLDSALEALPESDRRVVVLHFFERQQFAQIGALLGKTPAAVQKQSVRALEKLARVLRGRGVAIPIGLLATGIAAESAKSAPAGLLASVTAAGLAGKTGVSTGMIFMITSHPKLSASCALVLLALPLTMQQLAIARAQSELAGLAIPIPGRPALPQTAWSPSRKYPQISASFQMDQVIRECRLADGMFGSLPLKMLLKKKLDAADPAVLARLISQLRSEPLGDRESFSIAALLLNSLGKKDIRLAMDKIADGWLSNPYEDQWRNLFGDFARQDLGAAETWLNKVIQVPRNDGGATDDVLFQFRSELFGQLVKNDPDKANDYASHSLPEALRMRIFYDSIQKGDAPQNDLQVGNLMKVIRPLQDGERLNAMGVVASRVIGGDLKFEKATAFVRCRELTEAERHDMAQAIAMNYLASKVPERGHTEGRAEFDGEVSRWLSEVMPGEGEEIAAASREAVERNWAVEAQRSLDDVSRLEAGTSRNEDIISALLGTKVFRSPQIEQALTQAARIQDQKKRDTTVEAIRSNSLR